MADKDNQNTTCPKTDQSEGTLKTVTCIWGSCEQSFNEITDVRVHITKHAAENNFKCGVSGDRFSQDYELQKHPRIHTGYSSRGEVMPVWCV